MRRFAVVASGLFATVVVACGDDGDVRQLPDAPPGQDASSADAPPAVGSANITAYIRRDPSQAPQTPVAGATVVAVRVNGSVGGMATTDAAGKASVEVEEGGTIHVAYPSEGGDTHLTSYVGVKPGDDLVVGESYWTAPVTTGTAGNLTFTFPTVPNASYYEVRSPCYNTYINQGSGSVSESITLGEYCPPVAPFAVVAYGNGWPAQALASIFLPAAAYVPGELTLAASQWVAEAKGLNYTTTVTGVHASTNASVDVTSSFAPEVNVGTYYYGYADNGSLSVEVSVPSTAIAHTATARLNRSGYSGRQYYYRTGASPTTFDGSKLPWVSGLAFADGQLAFLKSSGAYDAGVARMSWREYVGKSTAYHSWNVIFPNDISSFEFATPPAQLSDYLPSDKSNELSADLELVDLSSAADYDAVRALPEWRVTNVYDSVLWNDEPSASAATYDVGEGSAFTR